MRRPKSMRMILQLPPQIKTLCSVLKRGMLRDVLEKSASHAVVAASGTVAASAGEIDAGTDAPLEAEPLVKEADPELERLLAEEEEIERRVHDHHETPKFHPGDGD